MAAMQLFDTHLHLDDEQFDGIRSEVVQRAEQSGVTSMVTIGTTAASSERCIAIAREFPSVRAAVGIQPNHAAEADPGDWARIVELCEAPEVVALGETGLDRYWDFTPFDVQQDYFDRHLRLSQQRDLPFIVHMRDCGEDIAVMLEEARTRGPLRGVMHSFTGGLELARRCLQLGLYISFAGMVTFKKSDALRDVAADIPADRILIETDAPYLAPHPHRGRKPNEPSLLPHTLQCLAEVRGVESSDFARQTTENARRLFRCAE